MMNATGSPVVGKGVAAYAPKWSAGVTAVAILAERKRDCEGIVGS